MIFFNNLKIARPFRKMNSTFFLMFGAFFKKFSKTKIFQRNSYNFAIAIAYLCAGALLKEHFFSRQICFFLRQIRVESIQQPRIFSLLICQNRNLQGWGTKNLIAKRYFLYVAWKIHSSKSADSNCDEGILSLSSKLLIFLTY